MNRDEMIAEMERLMAEAAKDPARPARSRFLVLRQLSRMTGKATDVILAALEGGEPERDLKTGAVVKDKKGRPVWRKPPPTRGQVKTALDVLSFMGIFDQTIRRHK